MYVSIIAYMYAMHIIMYYGSADIPTLNPYQQQITVNLAPSKPYY